ncbi:MAG: hypothetical protein WED04_03150 [Promethearchaeati archaeon SRVP18_Atabeyarchaeia-1]
MCREPSADGVEIDLMSEIILGNGAVEHIVDVLFSIGAIVVFAQLLFAVRRGVSSGFTPRRVVEIAVDAVILVVCLDWVAGFDFFRDTVAPQVWSFLMSLVK